MRKLKRIGEGQFSSFLSQIYRLLVAQRCLLIRSVWVIGILCQISQRTVVATNLSTLN